MDTSDPSISFDEHGYCNNCITAMKLLEKVEFNISNVGLRIFDEIRASRGNSNYDCIIGLSGGIDSSWALHLAVENGLSPLVVHVDGGWNSEVATSNIHKLVNKLELDLHTVVIDWNTMRDLQIAYFESGLANQDVPQDHAFFASLYKTASNFKIKSVLTGSNFSTESILPKVWEYDAMDGKQVAYIYKSKFKKKLNNYPVLTIKKYYLKHILFEQMRVFKPLNFLPYNKNIAAFELERIYGWKPYGQKHLESKFTEFFQTVYLPERLGIDKRKAHLSSLIMSNHMSRQEAIDILRQPPTTELRKYELIDFVERKLLKESGYILKAIQKPLVNYTAFPNDEKSLKRWSKPLIIKAVKKLGKLT